MGFGYMNHPNWRIYCEDHAELEIKQRLDNFPTLYYERAIKFARQINKQADQFGIKPAVFDPDLRKVSTRTLAVKKTLPKSVRDAKIIEVFLKSYLQNNSSPKERFTIILLKDPSGGLSLKEVTIPKDTSSSTQKSTRLVPTHPQKSTMLVKRKPQNSHPLKKKGKSQPRLKGKFYSPNKSKKDVKEQTETVETRSLKAACEGDEGELDEEDEG
jgi:hypothetical protein